MCVVLSVVFFLYCFSVFFFKQKTAYEMRISDWSPDVCSSDLVSIQAGPFLFKWVRADSEAVGRPDIDRRLRGFPQLAASSTASPALCTSSPAPSTVLQALMNKAPRSEEHTSELQSLMRISYAVFCLTKKYRSSQQH